MHVLFRNDISGTGGLTKQGQGSLQLSGSSFIGDTTVNEGTLLVIGNVANSDVTVMQGTALLCSGCVGAPNARAGFFIGNQAGTLTVTGNYAANTGSTLRVDPCAIIGLGPQRLTAASTGGRLLELFSRQAG